MIKQLKINKMKRFNGKTMIKSFVYAICLVLLLSCNNSKKQEEIEKEKAKQQAYADSIAEITRLQELAMQDSIDRILDSLAVFAWGDAKFGISVQDALKTDAFRGYELKKTYNTSNASTYKLKKEFDDNYPFLRIEASFYDDRLYSVHMDGKTIECNNEEEYERKMNMSLNEYKSMIAEKYLEPSEIHDLPLYYSIRHNEKFVIFKWKIYDKNISIGFQRWSVGNHYDIWCSIGSDMEWNLINDKEKAKRLQKEEEENNLKKKNTDELNLF